MKNFTDAIALRPGVAQYHDQLGNAYEQTAPSAGMLERMSIAKKAKAEWERAVQLDPNFIAARQSLVEFYLLAPAMMGGGDSAALEQAAEIRKRDAIEGHRAFARGMALYAFTLGQEVGVDVEYMGEDFDRLQIARHFFSPREVEAR